MEQLVDQVVEQDAVESLVDQVVGQDAMESLVEQVVEQLVVEGLVEHLAVPPDAVEGTAGITAATTSFEAMCCPEGTDQ